MAVRLLLPDTTHALIIELAAVRWIREEYFGIEFLKLPTSDQARLAHFVLKARRSPCNAWVPTRLGQSDNAVPRIRRRSSQLGPDCYLLPAQS